MSLTEERLSDFPGNSQEAKYRRMKLHIMASGKHKGKSGEELNAYVYGAMRARGWKPKRERTNENVNARVRHNIDTRHAYHALKGSKDLEFKRAASRRPGVAKFPVVEQARRWLDEIMDPVYTAPAMNVNPVGKLVKKAYKAGEREFKREVVRPYRSSAMALRHYRRAKTVAKSGRTVHARLMRSRARAVLANRSASLAGGLTGAVAGTVIPGPQGGLLLNTAMGAKAGRKFAERIRRRRV